MDLPKSRSARSDSDGEIEQVQLPVAQPIEVDHPAAGPPAGLTCCVMLDDISADPELYVEYRTAPSGRWFAAKWSSEWVAQLLTDYNPFGPPVASPAPQSAFEQPGAFTHLGIS